CYRLGLPRFKDVEFECASIPSSPRASGGFTVEVESRFGDEFTGLWETARARWPITCGVERSRDWVRYKDGGHLCLSLRDGDGALAGYLAIDRFSLLVALLARTPDELTRGLTAALGWLAEGRGPAEHLHPAGIKAMVTPSLRPALDGLGFETVDFTFALV